MPEPSGQALSVASARRHDAVQNLERELARIDREPGFSMSGQPLPEHIRRQRQEGREDVAGKIERLRALSGYELVAEFAPSLLPSDEPEEEPPAINEMLNRGHPNPVTFKVGGKVEMANPSYLAEYNARMAEQQAEAERQQRIKAGQEALALAALGGQEG
jgi:hypothetical protein